MKRKIALIVTLVLALALISCLTACGEQDVTGEYKFVSLDVKMPNIPTISLKVGDPWLDEEPLTVDDFVLTLKDDGSFELFLKFEDFLPAGTWEKTDDGVSLYFTETHAVVDAPIEENKITIIMKNIYDSDDLSEAMDVTLVLEKAA